MNNALSALAAISLAATLAGAGCSNANSTGDMSAAADLSIPPQFELSGTYAAELVANVSGGATGTMKIDTLMVTFNTPASDGVTATISVDWHPCGVTLPGGLSVPYTRVLEPLSILAQNAGTLSARGDGSQFTSTTTTVYIGYCPKSLSDPLPDATTPLCPAIDASHPNPCQITTQQPCVFQTQDSGGTVYPGVPIAVTGLNPDADVIYVDSALTYSLTATVDLNGLTGTPTATTATWNILGCHLRAGGTCSTAQLAMLNASKPQLTFSGGTFKAHVQPQYYTCPLFMADPSDSITTFDPLDGGVPDGGLSGMSYRVIQNDIDAMGCATCHDDPDGPSRLQLVYKPWNEKLVRRNYEAILPFTLPSTAHGRMGGRFVHGKAPLPGWMKQRWIDWVAAGAPY